MHESHRTTTSTLDRLPDVATLDADRADRFGTFLTVEAAADLASGRSSGRTFPARRALVGVAAASVLAGGLFAANAVVGGPGPADVPAAVAIEHTDGWTKITILDPTAAPSEIEAELEAAGIDARIQVLDVDATGTVQVHGGSVYTKTGGPDLDDWEVNFIGAHSFSLLGHAHAGPGDLTGVEVDLGDDAHLPTTPEAKADVDRWTNDYFAALEQAGVRVDHALAEPGFVGHSTVSIRDGADVDLVLYAQP